MWLWINNDLVPVTLRIPREFYINFRSTPGDEELSEYYSRSKVARVLPRERPCLHLYKYSMTEDIYRQGEAYFSRIINNPNVDGAYELQVSLKL